MPRLPKQSEYPKRIYFAKECYRVRFIRGFKHYGETDWAKKEIRIRAGMSSRQTLLTALHELLHLIEGEAPIKIKHKQVYRISESLVEILLDNFF